MSEDLWNEVNSIYIAHFTTDIVSKQLYRKKMYCLNGPHIRNDALIHVVEMTFVRTVKGKKNNSPVMS